jgi:hypothetical protein
MIGHQNIWNKINGIEGRNRLFYINSWKCQYLLFVMDGATRRKVKK